MKNYKSLLKKISKWMKEDSLLFVHFFCHKTFAYHFEVHLLTIKLHFYSPLGTGFIYRKWLPFVGMWLCFVSTDVHHT
jgi:cyclopropane fatty-acyl-phospholipid synthase-like methyltransferase